MTAKATISLPDELLERLDVEAIELAISRSEFVQESLGVLSRQGCGSACR